MRKILMFSLLIFGLEAIPAQAESIVKPATHAWIDVGNSSAMVPVRSERQCRQMMEQAARIQGSSKGHCYLNNDLKFVLKCSLVTHGKSKYDLSGTVECQ